MTPKTLRRKTQKKLKHKPYIKCPMCAGRMVGIVACEGIRYKCRTPGCFQIADRFWTGGGTGRHIPGSPGKA